MTGKLNKLDVYVCINGNQWFRVDITKQSIEEQFNEMPKIYIEGQLLDDWKEAEDEQ